MYKIIIDTFWTIFCGVNITSAFALIIFHFVFYFNRPYIWLEIWSPEGQAYLVQNKLDESAKAESDPKKCALIVVPVEITELRLPIATMDGKIVDNDDKVWQMFTRSYLFPIDKENDPLKEDGNFNFEYSGLVSGIKEIRLKVTCRFRSNQGVNSQIGTILSIFQHPINIKISKLPKEIREYLNNGITVRENGFRKVWLIRQPLFFWQKYQFRDITRRPRDNNWLVVQWEREHPWNGWD